MIFLIKSFVVFFFHSAVNQTERTKDITATQSGRSANINQALLKSVFLSFVLKQNRNIILRGHADPGAVAVALIFEAMAAAQK